MVEDPFSDRSVPVSPRSAAKIGAEAVRKFQIKMQFKKHVPILNWNRES